MKLVKIIFIVISVVISIIIIYAIINSEISYKYEIADRPEDKVEIQWVTEHLFNTIEWLKYFLAYVIVNIIYLLISIFSKRK
jgi:hypothetical protein